MSVRGIFTQTDVSKHHHLREVCLDSPHRPYDDAVSTIRLGAQFVFLMLGNNAKQQHLVDAQREQFTDILEQSIDREAIYSLHARHLSLYALTLLNKVGVDKVLW